MVKRQKVSKYYETDCGCNSVTMMFGTGKSKTLKAFSKISLKYARDVDANFEDVMREGKQFVAKCYGRNQLGSSENRCTI